MISLCLSFSLLFGNPSCEQDLGNGYKLFKNAKTLTDCELILTEDIPQGNQFIIRRTLSRIPVACEKLDEPILIFQNGISAPETR